MAFNAIGSRTWLWFLSSHEATADVHWCSETWLASTTSAAPAGSCSMAPAFPTTDLSWGTRGAAATWTGEVLHTFLRWMRTWLVRTSFERVLMLSGQACGAGHGHELDSSLLIWVLQEKKSPSEKNHLKPVTISENFRDLGCSLKVESSCPLSNIIHFMQFHRINFNWANAQHLKWFLYSSWTR